MKKKELLDYVLEYIPVVRSTEDLENVVLIAYNKAIEDAENAVNEHTDNKAHDLEHLKIKE